MKRYHRSELFQGGCPLDIRNHTLSLDRVWALSSMNPALKKILVFMLISVLLCSSAAGFVRFFSNTDSASGALAPADWSIRDISSDFHPQEPIKTEESASLVYHISQSSQNSGTNVWHSVLRLFLRVLLTAGFCFCCIQAVRQTSPVCWITSTCSHLYIISYIFSLSSYDGSSLR